MRWDETRPPVGMSEENAVNGTPPGGTVRIINLIIFFTS